MNRVNPAETIPPPKTEPPHLIGYARVSMTDQNNQRQIDALTAFGVHPDDIYRDMASGRTMRRKGWQACWRDLRDGDMLVVQSIDRLGRDVIEVGHTVKELHAKGANLKVLDQPGLDTRSSTGRMIFNVLLALAQWERESIVERTQHGLKMARERGVIGGAKPKVPDAAIRRAMTRMAHGERVSDIAADLGIGKQTLYRRITQVRSKAA